MGLKDKCSKEEQTGFGVGIIPCFNITHFCYFCCEHQTHPPG